MGAQVHKNSYVLMPVWLCRKRESDCRDAGGRGRRGAVAEVSKKGVSWLLLALCLWLQTTDVSSQQPGEPGVINIDGQLVQIAMTQGSLALISEGDMAAAKSDAAFVQKIARLRKQIAQHLELTQAQEERTFSDTQSVYRATSYARSLIEKVELLIGRLAFLDEDSEITGQIGAAADVYDVPEIKRLLQEKLALDDETLAEAAFQLGGFQELDGEYQDAWANYQKASNLQPGNQLYMDAHGKNQF